MRSYDFLVIGGGIAGMSFALKAAGHGRVALLAKRSLEDSNTNQAQVGSSRVDLQACKLEYSIVSPK